MAAAKYDFAIEQRTSFNKSIRKNYANIGYKYDLEKDAFIPPKPFQF